MSERDIRQEREPEGGTAVLERPQETPVKLDRMPPWKVLLHNDEVNEMGDVVAAILDLTPLRRGEAVQRMLEAHTRGCALLLCTHREHAELLVEQFATKRMTITIEADA
ncbi:MAG: ATP-dependent Clp protease adaptor ClpS [Phycisphaerales bacterium]|nr:ATP-dependent Clp protease adaptor ClpS [Phycisphaerae bacterium]NNF43133.1 ATP-dependent Clp protease adaptor ClpS [Phycisphaerales bacterium]NNM24641.1 ATP-dependent Clp protease adaptor ClpS [Phycisphaerales bacterium]